MGEGGLEAARRLVDEARGYLAKGDPVQASEKLYKVAETCVKALAERHVEDVYKEASEKGRWTVALLERAVEGIADRFGEDFRRWWDTAWTLHVWGFHEEKLDIEGVKRRVEDVESILKLASSAAEK